MSITTLPLSKTVPPRSVQDVKKRIQAPPPRPVAKKPVTPLIPRKPAIPTTPPIAVGLSLSTQKALTEASNTDYYDPNKKDVDLYTKNYTGSNQAERVKVYIPGSSVNTQGGDDQLLSFAQVNASLGQGNDAVYLGFWSHGSKVQLGNGNNVADIDSSNNSITAGAAKTQSNNVIKLNFGQDNTVQFSGIGHNIVAIQPGASGIIKGSGEKNGKTVVVFQSSRSDYRMTRVGDQTLFTHIANGATTRIDNRTVTQIEFTAP